jgi:L-2-hydroxyglutarate oxidase
MCLLVIMPPEYLIIVEVRNPTTALVVGGGIVGLATAFRLSQKLPDADITVIEKESAVGRHQSGHNSGVLHAGLYYKPGSTKARLAVRGIRQMVEFCQEHSIPHEICGKLVVAANAEELPRLRDLHERGRQNGLDGIRMLGPSEMREIEPHVGGVTALRVPQEGIVDYGKVCQAEATHRGPSTPREPRRHRGGL